MRQVLSPLAEIEERAGRSLWYAILAEREPSGGRAEGDRRAGGDVRAGSDVRAEGDASADGDGRLDGDGWVAARRPRAARALRVRSWDPSEPPAVRMAERGGTVVVVAGALHNRDELAARYGLGPSEHDADVVLEGYRRGRVGILRSLRGVFAVLVWDDAEERLVAARDHLGIYPLFWARAGDAMVLSTSSDAVLRHPAVSSSLSRVAMLDHLRHRYPFREETFFEALHRVPPGHALVAEGAEQRLERYWDPAVPGRPVEWLTPDEYERFDHLLDQAVTRCLQLGPSAMYLSGGLDSVSVAAVATDNARRLGMPPPLALSLSFPHPDCNEEDRQRGVAATLGLEQVMLDVEAAVAPAGLLLAGLRMSASWPAPLLNFWLPAYCRLAAEGRERGRSVVMTGGGGDEWLSVGPYYAADLLRRGDLPGLARLWRVWQRSYPLSNLDLARNALWKFGVKPLVGEVFTRAVWRTAPELKAARRRRIDARGLPAWMAPRPDLRERLLDRARPRTPTPGLGDLGFYVTEGREALDHPIVAMEMEEDFEVARRLGLLEIHPYWDPDLVDFLFRAPPEALMRGGRGKGMVREMLARRFPDLGFESQKKVVSTNYFAEQVLGAGRAAWDRMGGAPALADLGIVDGRRVASYLDGVLERRDVRNAYRVWDVLSLEAWVRPRA